MGLVAPEGQTVSTLRAGDPVNGVFACVRKDRRTTRTGSPFLSLELRDRTGTVPARAFRDADLLSGRFERGDLVHVVGRVERFRDELVVEVSEVSRASEEAADPGEFLPVAYRDMEELDGFLEHLAREVFDPGYRRLLDSFLGDGEWRDSFRRAPCTRGGHHAYLGGLLEHTVAVATLAREVCDLHRRLDSDLLLTAALLHDIGRIREFTLGAEIGVSEEGALLGHVTIGVGMLEERTRALEIDEGRRLALLHSVLVHHGAPGGRFGSAEALALYRVNAVDAAVKGVLEHGLDQTARS
jgi:3'-5' exoribonuclease